jgi:hypothetical protein
MKVKLRNVFPKDLRPNDQLLLGGQIQLVLRIEEMNGALHVHTRSFHGTKGVLVCKAEDDLTVVV